MSVPRECPKRTHTCGELRLSDAGTRVTLNGWIESRRDLGTLVFIDLRDRYGVTQVALDPGTDPALKEAAKELRPEYVLSVTGTVRPRPEEARNPRKATGEVEVAAESILILNTAKTPPFEISDAVKVSDELRLRHRYLDLRRRRMTENLLLRHRVVLAVRNTLSGLGFVEVETPVLTRSTPEGARDFLVPSRLHKGAFYALPQSPQLFKQLLMVGGLDRYFQVVRCIRDEDLRADRQPEFTQLDLELSFAEEEDVFEVVEEVTARIFEAAGREAPPRPYPRVAYGEAMERWGTDKPDTRFGMELFDLSDLAARSGFKIFRSAVEQPGGVVLGITAPGCAAYSRKDLDGLSSFAVERGGKGIAWFKVEEGGLASPLAKFFPPELQAELTARAGAAPGDLVLAVADRARRARLVLGELRVEMARRLGLAGGQAALCWVVDFPMFEEEEETGRLVPSHHPFTTPREEYPGHLEKDPATLKARAYDLVMNGVELGSGSVRIHRRDLQGRVFRALGITPEEARRKFGFLLDAFEYGAPPHAGIALGLDRLVMLLAGEENIREVIAFPKTATGACPLTGAPAPVEEELLEELGIALRKKGKNKNG